MLTRIGVTKLCVSLLISDTLALSEAAIKQYCQEGNSTSLAADSHAAAQEMQVPLDMPARDENCNHSTRHVI